MCCHASELFIVLWFAGVFREATTSFSVDARALTRAGGKHIKAQVKNPSGDDTDCVISDNGDGTYSVEYTPFENGTTSSDYNLTPFCKIVLNCLRC